MSLIIQLLTFVLVLLSLFLTVGVPVILATPGQWEVSKNRVWPNDPILWGSKAARPGTILTGFLMDFDKPKTFQEHCFCH